MRTFIISLVVLSFLMAGISIYSKYLDDAMNDIDECLKQISSYTNTNNWDTCKEKVYDLADIWNKNEPILAMFNDHEDVDKVKLAIGELKENVLLEEYAHTTKSLKETKILLERIKKNETLSLENILKVSHYDSNCHNMLYPA